MFRVFCFIIGIITEYGDVVRWRGIIMITCMAGSGGTLCRSPIFCEIRALIEDYIRSEMMMMTMIVLVGIFDACVCRKLRVRYISKEVSCVFLLDALLLT